MNFVIWLLITCFTKAEEVEEKNEAEFSRNSRLCRLYWLTYLILIYPESSHRVKHGPTIQ